MLRRFYSLKNSLALHFALLALVPMFAVSLLADVMLSRQLREDSLENLYFLALDIREETSFFLSQPVKDLEQLRLLLDIPGISHGRKVDDLFEATLKTSPYFRAVYQLDQTGRVMHAGLPGQNLVGESDYKNIDLSGLRLQTNEKAKEDLKPFWSEVFRNIQDGELTIAVCIPVGRGVLAGFVDLAHIDKLLERMTHSHPGTFAIVDQIGELLVHSRKKQNAPLFNYRRHPEIVAALQEGTEARANLHEDERTFESVTLIPETGWAVYVARDRDEIFAPVVRLRKAMTVLVGLVAILSVLLGLFFARWLSKPLSLLADHANRLAEGEGDYPTLPSSYIELDDLAEDFQAMAEAVQEREDSLQKSRLRFQSLVESVDGIVWELDLDSFMFTYVSQQAETLLGYPVADWYASNEFWQKHIHPDDRDWAVDFCLTQSAQGKDHTFDYRMIAADGRAVWFHDLVTVVMEDGQPVRLRGVMIDMTLQKEADLLLLENEKRFRGYFELGLIGMALTGADKEWIQVNSTLCQMLNFNENELLRKTWTELTLVEDLEKELKEFTRLEAGEIDSYRLDKGFLRKDGDLVEVSVAVQALRNSDGSINHCLMLIQDISERQKLQRQNVRTAQLATLGELAAGVAHEINNPINGVINYAQILANRMPEETRDRDLVERIIKEGDRVAGIVRNLLYFARDQKPRFVETRLADLIEECLSLTRAQLAKDGTMLLLQVAEGLPPIQAQAQQLQQLLLNLIGNARYALNQKYSGRDDNKILAIKVAHDQQKDVLRLTCKDHGIGIPAALLAKVMNPFMTTKPAGVGTGLGLSISREIVDKHGGSLTLDSVEGEYTCVTVELPLSPASVL